MTSGTEEERREEEWEQKREGKSGDVGKKK